MLAWGFIAYHCRVRPGGRHGEPAPRRGSTAGRHRQFLAMRRLATIPVTAERVSQLTVQPHRGLLARSCRRAVDGQRRQRGRHRFAGIDRVVEEAIAAKAAPGAVVLVGRDDAIVFEKAYGQRAVAPAAEAMTLDTIFDLASLTKVVATTTAVMQLIEQGRIRLNDPVASFVPGFERYGKGGDHDSPSADARLGTAARCRSRRPLAGLRHGHRARPRRSADLGAGRALRLQRHQLLRARRDRRARQRHAARSVRAARRVSAARHDRHRLPAGDRQAAARIAPTERCETHGRVAVQHAGAAPLRGVVHDPTARRMGGVAGHAGLFSTARDLSRFARMLLNGGRARAPRRCCRR